MAEAEVATFKVKERKSNYQSWRVKVEKRIPYLFLSFNIDKSIFHIKVLLGSFLTAYYKCKSDCWIKKLQTQEGRVCPRPIDSVSFDPDAPQSNLLLVLYQFPHLGKNLCLSWSLVTSALLVHYGQTNLQCWMFANEFCQKNQQHSNCNNYMIWAFLLLNFLYVPTKRTFH